MLKHTLAGLALLAGLSFTAQAQTYTPPKKPQNLKELQGTTVTKNDNFLRISEGVLLEGKRIEFSRKVQSCKVHPGGTSIISLPGGLYVTCVVNGIASAMYVSAGGNGMITPEHVLSVLDTFGPDSTDGKSGVNLYGVQSEKPACPNWMKSYFWPGDDKLCFEINVVQSYQIKERSR